MKEKRKEPRLQVSFFLRIYNKETDEVIGHLIDLGADGMRILSDRPVAINVEYSLAIDLSSVMNFEQEVLFCAVCIWNEQEFSSGAYNCGFEVVKMAKKERTIIEQLLSQFNE